MQDEDKTEVRRKLAASSLRQVARLMDEESTALRGPTRQELIIGSRAAEAVAQRIEQGRIEEREWEFLTWLAQPKLNPDGSPEPDATSVKPKRSGSKKSKVASALPSTPIPPSDSSMAATSASKGQATTSSPSSPKKNAG